MNTLELLKAERAVSDRGSQMKRAFLDFVVDGISLYETIGCQSDLISTLWINPPMGKGEQNKVIRRLLTLNAADLPDDRVSLYVCPECGDLGCGAISLQISVDDKQVTWSDFGYENNYEHHVIEIRTGSLGRSTLVVELMRPLWVRAYFS